MTETREERKRKWQKERKMILNVSKWGSIGLILFVAFAVSYLKPRADYLQKMNQYSKIHSSLIESREDEPPYVIEGRNGKTLCLDEKSSTETSKLYRLCEEK